MAANAAVIRRATARNEPPTSLHTLPVEQLRRFGDHVTVATVTGNNDPEPAVAAITVAANGPYLVAGGLALHRRRDVQSELGEPMTWATTSTLETKDRYTLCRCGQSSNKPFCDGTHQ